MSETQLGRMLSLARKAHQGQTYGQGNDYFEYHILGTLAELLFIPEFKQLQSQDAEKAMCVTVGHDVIEETPNSGEGAVTKDTLLKEDFDVDVVEAISLVSKDGTKGKKPYLRDIRANFLARLAKQADTQFNLKQSIKDGNHKSIMHYSEQLAILTNITQ